MFADPEHSQDLPENQDFDVDATCADDKTLDAFMAEVERRQKAAFGPGSWSPDKDPAFAKAMGERFERTEREEAARRLTALSEARRQMDENPGLVILMGVYTIDSPSYPPDLWEWPEDKRNEYFAEESEKAARKANGDARRSGTQPPEIITRRADEIELKALDWLWKYWLARGKMHILAGVPETGKTTIALCFAAVILSGGMWPDGTYATIGDVLIWTSEDDPEDTLIPRLMRMGADLSRIHFVVQARDKGRERTFNPATDMAALEAKAIAIGNVALLILDPIVAAVPMSRNSHNNAEARNGMQPVVDFARATKTCVLGIGHLTKGTVGKDPLERINGSGAFGALPRLVMGAAKNLEEGDDQPERIMVRVKSNIGPY